VEVFDSRTAMTREGYEEARRELEELVRVKRPAVTERIREARALGDISENFDYHDAKRQQGMIEGRIMQLKTLIDCATIIECNGGNGCVGLGSKVTIKDAEEGYEDEYIIVGPQEADPSGGKISCESSVGGALMGCKEGDQVVVETPAGTFTYEIIAVR
jgi:transcription elongation factor GreA